MFQEGLVSRILINFIGFYVATLLLDGFEIYRWTSALGAAVILVIVNVTIGFFLKILSFPFIVLSLGLFIFVINAISLKIVDSFIDGIDIHGFGTAILAAIIIALANMLLVSKRG